MANEPTKAYPDAAYAPNGELWWRLQLAPGSKRPFGVEQKLAAWLRFNKQVGDTFTTREARAALGEPDQPNADEHFQRRLRELRNVDGWIIPSTKYDPTLDREQYRVEKVGWHPGRGDTRKKKPKVSDSTRAAVFKRDGSRCVVCAIGAGEPYPEAPERQAVLTVGHVLSQEFGGSSEIRNLRTECARCNEPLRSEAGKPESVEEIRTAARKLSKVDRSRLAQWITAGRRIRDATDELYDRYRRLAPGDQEIVLAEILKLAGKSNS